jgi:serine phosphatase RsbU (regulator of sigma subunit)
MRDHEQDYLSRYTQAFQRYVSQPDEAALEQAYELGRQAVLERMSQLDVAQVHHQALLAAITGRPDLAIDYVVKLASAFGAENLSTFEMVQRGYFEAEQVLNLERQHSLQLRRRAVAYERIGLSSTVDELASTVAEQAATILGARQALFRIPPHGDLDAPTILAWPQVLGAERQGYRDAILALGLHKLVGPQRRRVRISAGQLEARLGSQIASRRARWSRSGWLGIAFISPRGANLGVLEVFDKRTGDFAENDEAIVSPIAQIASAAIENRRLYDREREIAVTLQRSLVPPSLPPVPGVELAALYRPAGEGYEVGGDFYDVFPVRGGEWGIALGDVCGKGPGAAATTGLVRHTLRAAALREDDPRAAVQAVNEAILRSESDEFCTLAFGRLRSTPRGLRVLVVCGGHPAPLVLRARGEVERIECEGALLGVLEDASLNLVPAHLRAGDSLLFYTDGVTDARIEAARMGEEGLEHLLAGCVGLPAAGIVASIEAELDRVKDQARRDDVAILVVRASP